MPEFLRGEHCTACRPDSPLITIEEERELLPQIPDWDIVEVKGQRRIRRSYVMGAWMEGFAFAQAVGQAADDVDHHPTILIVWGKVTVTWWTHAIGGLHRNDLIMAARTDDLYEASDSARHA